jgi:ABC-2 type transport system ATP-binding protein
VRFEGVGYTYARADRPAVTGLTFTLERGVTGLLGVNGAGKTTVMKLAVGELHPRRGHIEKAAAPPGYCPQAASLPASFTVVEVLTYLAWLRGTPRAQRSALVSQAVERAGLADRADSRVRTLSGGMQRRVALAQAFLGDPEVVLLDEPTTGLDPEQRVRCRELVREVRSASRVLLSSHIIEDVADLCDRVLVVHEGRLARVFGSAELAGLPAAELERRFLSVVTGAAA